MRSDAFTMKILLLFVVSLKTIASLAKFAFAQILFVIFECIFIWMLFSFITIISLILSRIFRREQKLTVNIDIIMIVEVNRLLCVLEGKKLTNIILQCALFFPFILHVHWYAEYAKKTSETSVQLKIPTYPPGYR